jgi:hypothetical protein
MLALQMVAVLAAGLLAGFGVINAIGLLSGSANRARALRLPLRFSPTWAEGPQGASRRERS